MDETPQTEQRSNETDEIEKHETDETDEIEKLTADDEYDVPTFLRQAAEGRNGTYEEDQPQEGEIETVEAVVDRITDVVQSELGEISPDQRLDLLTGLVDRITSIVNDISAVTIPSASDMLARLSESIEEQSTERSLNAALNLLDMASRTEGGLLSIESARALADKIATRLADRL